MNKKILPAFEISILIIFSSMLPIVIGFNSEANDQDFSDVLSLECYDGSYFIKNNFLKKYLHPSPSINENLPIETLLPVELPIANQVGPMDSPWPMKCHDAQHTSRSPYSTFNNQGYEKWRFKTDGWIDGGLCIGNDGTIYFGGNYKGLPWYIFAVNSDGALKWRYKTGGLIWSTPAIAEDGTIYIGSWDDYVHAIDQDGELKWKFCTRANIVSSPAIAEDGTIYLGTMWSLGEGGKIHAVNPNGTEKWHYQTGDAITSDPAIGNDGTIYIGSCDNYLYAINPDGTLQWRFRTGDEIHGDPSIADDGTIYIGSYDDYLYAIYPNGTLRWKYKLNTGTSGNPSIGHDGTIYVGSDKFYALTPNGELKWDFGLGVPDMYIGFSAPAIGADGSIYFGTCIGTTSGGDIIAVNADGTEKWRKRIADDWVDSSPCIGEDGTVYIGSSSNNLGYLHAFRVGENSPPNKPTIDGTKNGRVGKHYDYNITSEDLDGDHIYYYIEFQEEEGYWTEDSYPSGMVIEKGWGWLDKGTYDIKVKAKDVSGAESGWATLRVSMPKSKPYNPFWQLLEQLIKRFPILEYLFTIV